MKIVFESIELKTDKKIEFYDITNQVKELIKKNKIKNGFVNIFTQHTTCAIKVHEWETEKDRALIKDSIEFLEKMASSKKTYRHDKTNVDDRPNTHAHLKSLMLNSNEIIPIQKGELLLGKWQGIYFIEMDGPREKRKAIIQIIGK